MVRVSFWFVVAVVFSLSDTYANGNSMVIDENDPDKTQLKDNKRKRITKLFSSNNLPGSFSKKKKLDDLNNSYQKDNSDTHPVTLTSSFEPVFIYSHSVTSSPVISQKITGMYEGNIANIYSPITRERKYFSPIRRALVLEEYKTRDQKKIAVPSPVVREIYNENNLSKYWTRCAHIEEKTVYQADFLFDPYALTGKEGITNLERMKKGDCPIGYKGIVSEMERERLNKEDIKKQEKLYRIELHHMTQKDTGTEEDPICETTYAAHMGKNARIILECNSEEEPNEVKVVQSSLTKEEANNLLLKKGQFMVTNTLHFRKAPSLINRDKFNTWKIKYWKERAAKIEKGNFDGRYDISAYIGPKKLVKSL